jgi:hypothetical protein
LGGIFLLPLVGGNAGDTDWRAVPSLIHAF